MPIMAPYLVEAWAGAGVSPPHGVQHIFYHQGCCRDSLHGLASALAHMAQAYRTDKVPPTASVPAVGPCPHTCRGNYLDYTSTHLCLCNSNPAAPPIEQSGGYRRWNCMTCSWPYDQASPKRKRSTKRQPQMRCGHSLALHSQFTGHGQE